MSTSTKGAPAWWCFAHFRADRGRLQCITAELRRVDWLSNAISDVRTRGQHQDYPAAYQRITHDLAMANRNDLAWTAPETEVQWLARLERELVTILAGTVAPTQARFEDWSPAPMLDETASTREQAHRAPLQR